VIPLPVHDAIGIERGIMAIDVPWFLQHRADEVIE
jgi:hypothetical protein